MREVKTSNHNVASVQQNPSLFCLELWAAEGSAGQAARNIGPASTSYTSVRRLYLGLGGWMARFIGAITFNAAGAFKTFQNHFQPKFWTNYNGHARYKKFRNADNVLSCASTQLQTANMGTWPFHPQCPVELQTGVRILSCTYVSRVLKYI